MNNFASFERQMSRNTKLLLLLAFILVLYGFFNAESNASIFVGALIGLVVVAGVDYFQIFAHNHPAIWSRVKFIVIAAIVLFTILAWVA